MAEKWIVSIRIKSFNGHIYIAQKPADQETLNRIIELIDRRQDFIFDDELITDTNFQSLTLERRVN